MRLKLPPSYRLQMKAKECRDNASSRAKILRDELHIKEMRRIRAMMVSDSPWGLGQRT